MGRKRNHILLYYLKDRLILFICFLMIVLIFLAVTALYGYEGSFMNMSYAAVLALFFGVWGYIFDFWRYRTKCIKLQEALDKKEESDYYLPGPSGYIEMLYYDIVCVAGQERRKLITKLDEKKADMADYYTMWTHQIKTPIAAMRLLLQRMEAEREKEEDIYKKQGKDTARQALEELFKVEQYAEMALHYARLDSMSSDMMFKEYDVNAIIRKAVKKYAVLFIGSGLSFSMENFECKAVTDEKWLGFVIEQVLANALKYTHEGSIRIYGADEEGKKCEGEVNHIVIEDTGIGIRESDLPRIFERGFTGYNGRIGKKSTGIGLYLCRQIMERLSHAIWVESKEREGTKVIFGFGEEEK